MVWSEGEGVISPTGGDLISEISLSLTKLCVKQSLVGNHGEGFLGGGREDRNGAHLGTERTSRLALQLVWPVCRMRQMS